MHGAVAGRPLATPGSRVIVRAIQDLHRALAGSLAIGLLVMFPLLILLSAAAAVMGEPGDATAQADRVIGYAPQLLRDALQPVIQQVLSRLLVVGLVATLWISLRACRRWHCPESLLRHRSRCRQSVPKNRSALKASAVGLGFNYGASRLSCGERRLAAWI